MYEDMGFMNRTGKNLVLEYEYLQYYLMTVTGDHN